MYQRTFSYRTVRRLGLAVVAYPPDEFTLNEKPSTFVARFILTGRRPMIRLDITPSSEVVTRSDNQQLAPSVQESLDTTLVSGFGLCDLFRPLEMQLLAQPPGYRT